MPYQRKTYAKGRGKKGPEKTWARPDPGERFPKFSLSPYATAQGSPFYLQRASKEKELLSLASIAAGRQPRNSEHTCLRLGLALSESAGTVEMGAEAMAGFLGDDPAAVKQGFQQLAEFFASSEGKDFAAAAATLNKNGNTTWQRRSRSGAKA